MLVNRVAGDLVGFVGRRIHAFHSQHFETGVAEIARKERVEFVVVEISAADEFLDPQRAQRFGLRHAGSEDRYFVFRFPAADNLSLGLVAAHHERRPAFGMDQIDADFSKLGNFDVIGFERAEITPLGMFSDTGVHRNATHTIWQQSNKLDQRARPIRRFYDADRPTPSS